MKAYVSRPLIYLATIAMLTAYELGAEVSYAANKRNSKQNTFLLDYSNRALNVGYNGKIRNINHDINGAKRELNKKKFEFNNKLKQRDHIVKIRIGKHVIRF